MGKVKNRHLTLMAVFCLLFVAYPALSDEKENPANGKSQYQANCSMCHGFDGKTKGPLAMKIDVTPADLTKAQYQKQSVEDLARLIGGYAVKRRNEMPHWGEGLAKSSISDIAAYVLTIKDEWDLLLDGDLRLGRTIYQTRCMTCHGLSGKGDGAYAKILKFKMKDYTKSDSIENLSDRELLEIINKGGSTYMIAWENVLKVDEIRDVAAYVRSLSQ